MSASIVTDVDASLALEPAEHVFDSMALAMAQVIMLDRPLRFDFDGMQATMPRSARTPRNRSASYPLSASNCLAGGGASMIGVVPQ